MTLFSRIVVESRSAAKDTLSSFLSGREEGGGGNSAVARKEERGREGRRDRGMSQHFSSSFLPSPACQKMMPMLSRAPPPPPRLRKGGGGGSAHSLPNGRTHTHTSFPLTPEGEKKYSGHAKEHYRKVTLPFFVLLPRAMEAQYFHLHHSPAQRRRE